MRSARRPTMSDRLSVLSGTWWVGVDVNGYPQLMQMSRSATSIYGMPLAVFAANCPPEVVTILQATGEDADRWLQIQQGERPVDTDVVFVGPINTHWWCPVHDGLGVIPRPFCEKWPDDPMKQCEPCPLHFRAAD